MVTFLCTREQKCSDLTWNLCDKTELLCGGSEQWVGSLAFWVLGSEVPCGQMAPKASYCRSSGCGWSPPFCVPQAS